MKKYVVVIALSMFLQSCARMEASKISNSSTGQDPLRTAILDEDQNPPSPEETPSPEQKCSLKPEEKVYGASSSAYCNPAKRIPQAYFKTPAKGPGVLAIASNCQNNLKADHQFLEKNNWPCEKAKAVVKNAKNCITQLNELVHQ